MHITAVTPDLVPALSALATATFSETFGHLYPPTDLQTFLQKSYALPRLTAEIEDPAQIWRMALDGGTAVAYLQIGPVTLPHPEADPARDGELKRLYIRATHQGRGLGRTLMSLALDELAARFGDAPQWIGVWSENHKAQALYGAHGFVRVGGYQFAVGETMDDEFILRRLP